MQLLWDQIEEHLARAKEPYWREGQLCCGCGEPLVPGPQSVGDASSTSYYVCLPEQVVWQHWVPRFGSARPSWKRFAETQ